jgi:SAM-dependent methyltransferase
MEIYLRTLRALKRRAFISNADTILVMAGGEHDRKSMLQAELQNVTISNLMPHAGLTEYKPYEWIRLDCENIEAGDSSFDWVVIHAGLHHLAVPQLGVAEMFRVARKGILCFEARDSTLMRAAVRMGLTDDYELESAFLSGGAFGGYRNGPIPNFVYRWTEREFEKTINSFAPTHTHTFFYEYGFRIPSQRFAMSKSAWYRGMGLVLAKLARSCELLIPKQGNQFAFGALKNVKVKPWLHDDMSFDGSFLSKKYDKSKYKRN